jgi:hypothetical protein
MKCRTFLFYKILFCVALFFVAEQAKAQDCTVNAGIDVELCFSNGIGGTVIDLFTLNGNSAGNINATPNRLWELVSAPPAAIVAFASPNNNTTLVRGKLNELPSGNYIFRLGINCQTGGRIYDSVMYTIKNVANFELFANKRWSDFCSNGQDSIMIVGRKLKVGEVLTIDGRSIEITYNGIVSYASSNFYGPTADSVRFKIKSTLANICTIADWPLVNYSIALSSCLTTSKVPTVNNVADMGIQKANLTKTGFRNVTDTLTCISNNEVIIIPNNICVKGGRVGGSEIGAIFSTTKLLGSGRISGCSFGTNSLIYTIENRWDTVTPNTLHIYEVTFTSNGCFTTFKDTIKVFFKSLAPVTTDFTLNNTLNFCKNRTEYPLASFKFPLYNSGSIPLRFKFYSTIINSPLGAIASITNPTSKDSLNIIGANIIPGYYKIATTILDSISGCFAITSKVDIELAKRATLPLLRDTFGCTTTYQNLLIPYSPATFGNGLGITSYWMSVLGSVSNSLYPGIANDSSISLQPYFNSTPPGEYDIAVRPNIFACNDGRSDTFHFSLKSGGYVGNAGTDQRLLCSVASTNLAGSLPSTTGGTTGFWKFLRSISSNAGNPIIITDSANRSTGISGFSNLSSYYFSWNVTRGNTGDYCNLLPDTVLVVFSGIPPTQVHAAQADYTGCLVNTGIYQLTSNATTPTFTVQWNKLSGANCTIVNPQNQNTTVTGLTTGNYVFEIVVSNTCGIFKDTVNLNFNCILPVNLISFTGKKDINNNDKITWKVSEEINLKQYELEVSADAASFTKLAMVATDNSTSNFKTYSYTNTATSANAINFYRLKIVNLNERSTYSNVIRLVNKRVDNISLEISPNPAFANLSLRISSLKKYRSAIQITDLTGQVVLKKEVELIKGEITEVIDVSKLPRGIYFLRIESVTSKLVLQ